MRTFSTHSYEWFAFRDAGYVPGCTKGHVVCPEGLRVLCQAYFRCVLDCCRCALFLNFFFHIPSGDDGFAYFFDKYCVVNDVSCGLWWY